MDKLIALTRFAAHVVIELRSYYSHRAMVDDIVKDTLKAMQLPPGLAASLAHASSTTLVDIVDLDDLTREALARSRVDFSDFAEQVERMKKFYAEAAPADASLGENEDEVMG